MSNENSVSVEMVDGTSRVMGPRPGIAILRFFQGIVEIALRTATIVSWPLVLHVFGFDGLIHVMEVGQGSRPSKLCTSAVWLGLPHCRVTISRSARVHAARAARLAFT